VASVAVNGLNASDFIIGTTNCVGTIAAGGNCTVPITFSPQAAGVRTTTLLVTDDAANSPQSLTLTGNAAPAVMIQVAIGGSTSVTVTAGQTAQFNLQATGGTGFTGSLSFACTGAPTGASCSAPNSVGVTNGAAVNFTVSVTTSGAASAAAASSSVTSLGTTCSSTTSSGAIVAKLLGEEAKWTGVVPLGGLTTMLALCVVVIAARGSRNRRLNACLAGMVFLWMAGCGNVGGAPSTAQQSPVPPPVAPVVTPAGTYTLMVTPTATPAGSTKMLQLTPISLTLIVK